MKNICLFSFSLLILLGGCRTSKPAAGTNSRANTSQVSVPENLPVLPDFSDPKTWLIGYFDPGKLSQEPYSEWYKKGYDDYQFNTEAVNQLIDKDKSGISIKVIMGTWCPDSRREIPRLMRILDIWQFTASNLTFIGVDDAKNSPVAEYNKLDIQKVPTIIIYKNNVEAGRIIEIPVTSLEQDMVNILSRNEK